MPKLSLKERLWNYCQAQVKRAEEDRNNNKDNDVTWFMRSGQIDAYKDILNKLLKESLGQEW